VTVTAPTSASVTNSALAKSITYTTGRLTFNADGSLKMDAQPVVTTVKYLNVSATSADVQGSLRDYKIGNVFKYGICYSTTATTPTTADSRAEPELISPSYQVPDSETFTMGLTGLRPATVYYARAYARTFTGIIVYGGVVSFRTLSAILYSNGVTVAGGNGYGSAPNQLGSPQGIYVDSTGAIYVADYENHRIQKWDAGAVAGITVAGGNRIPGGRADQLNSPRDVQVDSDGAVYIADFRNNRIQKWAAGASSGITLAGSYTTGSNANQFAGIAGIHLDKGRALYVSDSGNNRIQKFGPNSNSATNGLTVAGGNGSGSATNQLRGPEDVYVDQARAVYVADYGNARIQKWAVGATSPVTVAGGNGIGTAANQFGFTASVFVDDNGDVYVADYSNERIQKWTVGAAVGLTVAGGNGSGSGPNQLNSPSGVYVDKMGAIYVSDQRNHRVQKFTPR
jgi:sugar lactone lactonase YvrE